MENPEVKDQSLQKQGLSSIWLASQMDFSQGIQRKQQPSSQVSIRLPGISKILGRHPGID